MNRETPNTATKGTDESISIDSTNDTPRVIAGISESDQKFVNSVAGGDNMTADLIGLQIRLDRKNGYLAATASPTAEYLAQALRRNQAMGGDRSVIAALNTALRNS